MMVNDDNYIYSVRTAVVESADRPGHYSIVVAMEWLSSPTRTEDDPDGLPTVAYADMERVRREKRVVPTTTPALTEPDVRQAAEEYVQHEIEREKSLGTA